LEDQSKPLLEVKVDQKLKDCLCSSLPIVAYLIATTLFPIMNVVNLISLKDNKKDDFPKDLKST